MMFFDGLLSSWCCWLLNLRRSAVQGVKVACTMSLGWPVSSSPRTLRNWWGLLNVES